MHDIEEMFKSFMASLGAQEATFAQVAKLKPEHVLKHRAFISRTRKIQRSMDSLHKKSQFLHAEYESFKTEHWNWIYDAYGIPSDQIYDIDKNGVIRKIVRKNVEEK